MPRPIDLHHHQANRIQLGQVVNLQPFRARTVAFAQVCFGDRVQASTACRLARRKHWSARIGLAQQPVGDPRAAHPAALEQRQPAHFVERAVGLRAARQVHAARAPFRARTIAQQRRGALEQRFEHVERFLGQADPAFGKVIHVQAVLVAAGAEIAPIAQQRQRQRVDQPVLHGVQ